MNGVIWSLSALRSWETIYSEYCSRKPWNVAKSLLYLPQWAMKGSGERIHTIKWVGLVPPIVRVAVLNNVTQWKLEQATAMSKCKFFHRFLSNRHDSISIAGCIFKAQKLITARLLAVLTKDVMRGERGLIHFLYDRQTDRDKWGKQMLRGLPDLQGIRVLT